MNGETDLAETGDALDLALRQYRSKAGRSDLMLGAEGAMAGHWTATLAALGDPQRGGLTSLQERAAQQVLDLGMAFRLAGEADERVWPLSPVPLLLSRQDWVGLQDGLAQRAELLEALLEDIYGEGRLIASGELPGAAIAGSIDYWRQMHGLAPPRGRRLQFLAFDLGRGPDGEWRVLADHVRTPVGAGYALENRLAMTRATNDLFARMNLMRLAPFFADFRQGLAAICERVDPRIALLTPGRLNQSYAEQAHLARYLGLLLVEGDDLIVREGKLFVRTIEGLKRIDGLWRRMTTQLLDPLTFDAHSTIGIPDLFEAIKSGASPSQLARLGPRRDAAARRIHAAIVQAADRPAAQDPQYRDLVVRTDGRARPCAREFRPARHRLRIRQAAAHLSRWPPAPRHPLHPEGARRRARPYGPAARRPDRAGAGPALDHAGADRRRPAAPAFHPAHVPRARRRGPLAGDAGRIRAPRRP